MLDRLGYSVYLSNYEQMKDQLSSLFREGSCVFTSCHMAEEYDDAYKSRMTAMCRELSEMGYEIVADVSKKTLELFGCTDIVGWAKELGITVLRLDCGFGDDEMAEIARKMPVCLNASTITKETLAQVSKDACQLFAMHNFYPRPETGLDEAYLREQNRWLSQAGIKVLAFIPGDEHLRGPLHEGIPTLEAHRGGSPYQAFVDLKRHFGVDGVFVGDGILSDMEQRLITAYETDGMIRLPVKFYEAASQYEAELCRRPFTIRVDSPRWLKRLQESREYACFGNAIAPAHSTERVRGAVTMDNERYLRYSGEVQIVIEALPADERVNVLAETPLRYQGLLDHLENGGMVFIEKIEAGTSLS